MVRHACEGAVWDTGVVSDAVAAEPEDGVEDGGESHLETVVCCIEDFFPVSVDFK